MSCFVPSVRLFVVTAVLLCCLLPGLLSAHNARNKQLNLTAAELAWLEEHPVVRLAPDPDFPPLEYIDKDGNYKGISADFIALLEKKTPLKFEIVQLDNWSEILRQAQSREIDMLGAAVPTPKRLEFMLFTEPYAEFPAVVLVQDSEKEFPKLNNLSGKRVAVVADYADHQYMLQAYPDVPLEVVPDISSGLRLVSFGRVDAMILNIATASYFIAKNGITNLKVTEDTDFIFDLSFACRNDWPELQSILAKGMAAITPQESKAILGNWISLNKNGWRPSPAFFIAVLVVFFLLTLFMVLSWNRSLKIQVQQRTRELQNELEERVLAEKEKEKLREQISRSKKMEALGLLAGGVAHDLNNILSGVSGYAELMLMKLPADSPFCKHAKAIRDSGQRAAAVVADMLTISRNAASDKRIANLNRLIQEYLCSPEHAALVRRYPQVRFSCNLSADLYNVSCSTTHIKKTIMNLVLNAAEATEVGEVVLSTENCCIDRPFGQYENVENGEYVLLRVCDTGPGISAEDLEHIFDPFFSRKKIGHSGTGLGLAVVWNTVRDHLGYIDVVQPEPHGSCFNLYLPMTCEDSVSEEVLADEETLRGAGEHILVIDDEENIRDLAQQMLTSLGYRVSCVGSGEAALDFLGRQKVDLLLLDMIMETGINGCETYQRAVALHPGLKALICSGFSESVEVQRAQSAGAGSYLKKPYSRLELAQAVREELTHNE